VRKLYIPLALLLGLGLVAAVPSARADFRVARPCGSPFAAGYCPPQQQYVAPGYTPPPTYAPTYFELLVPLPVFIDPRISYQHAGLNVVPPPPAAAAAPAKPAGRKVADLTVDELSKLIDARVARATPGPEYGAAAPDTGPPPVPGYRAGRAQLTAALVIGKSCGRCHSGDKAAGGFAIFDQDGRGLLDADGAGRVAEVVRTKRMPPAKSPEHAELTDEARRVVLQELGGGSE
jgi:hypothetical protein